MKKFGKYEVVEQIAVGGFGTVYRGFDPVIKRPVAIKACTSQDRTTRERFQLEAEIGGNLHHRNITTVHDFGVEGETPFLVQELLDGEDLDRKIKRREDVSPGKKLLYLTQIARGLEHAHSKGVVHRDLKPANVHILPDGTVKIMDFGIARLTHQETGFTTAGQTVGTTAYLAPEQIRGEELDQRADIFSFGALSYELLTYERAFKGDTISSLMYSILSERPQEIARHWADCPPALSDLVERCLEKEPDRRPQEFSEIVGELSKIRVESSPHSLRARRPEPRPESAEPTVTAPTTQIPAAPAPVAPAPPAPAAAETRSWRSPWIGVGAGVTAFAILALAAALWVGSRPEAAPGDAGAEAPAPPAATDAAAPAGPGAPQVTGSEHVRPVQAPTETAKDRPAASRDRPAGVESPRRESESSRAPAPRTTVKEPAAAIEPPRPSAEGLTGGPGTPAEPQRPPAPPPDPGSRTEPPRAPVPAPASPPATTPPPATTEVPAPPQAENPGPAPATLPAPEQTAATPPAPAEDLPDPAAGVREAIDRWAAAWSRMDRAAILRAHPGLSGRDVDQALRGKKSYSAEIAACGTPKVAGDTASISCSYTIRSDAGRGPETFSMKAAFELERSGAVWAISKLTPER